MHVAGPTARLFGARAACRSACVCLCIWAACANN